MKIKTLFKKKNRFKAMNGAKIKQPTATFDHFHFGSMARVQFITSDRVHVPLFVFLGFVVVSVGALNVAFY